uniref:Uncharacterized protein n=1 Tax=Amphimedon queenslandica TaxID=400682 RepID=A0A1X7VU23_AMPQE
MTGQGISLDYYIYNSTKYKLYHFSHTVYVHAYTYHTHM